MVIKKTTNKRKKESLDKAKKVKGESKAKKEKNIGKVLHYFRKPKVGVIKLKAPLSVDEKIRIKGGDVDFEQKIKSMEIEKKKITKAKAKQEVGIKLNKKAREGYGVYKIED